MKINYSFLQELFPVIHLNQKINNYLALIFMNRIKWLYYYYQTANRLSILTNICMRIHMHNPYVTTIDSNISQKLQI